MINEMMYDFGNAPSAIRELFAYGQARKAQIGDENVYDFSIGNPSVPTPPQIHNAIEELNALPPAQLHAYTAAQGAEGPRAAIAKNLNDRFATSYTADNFYLTAGAAASLSCAFNALLHPGEEVIIPTPYFPEYKTWLDTARCKTVEVPTRAEDFQLDIAAIEAAITPLTRIIVINSPNNPVGSVYHEQGLRDLAQMLERKSAEIGQPIFIVSDEPYRELVYDGLQVPWIPSIYPNTIVCYSWSKCFSLPGERIGYVLVPPEAADSTRLYKAVCGAGRALGYICAPVLFQYVIEKCVDAPVNIEPYRENRAILTEILDSLGYTYIEPQGAFYLWMKALEPDAQAFSDKAKAHELLLVPSDSFGVPGWVRVGYCVSRETIEGSRSAFEALKADYR